LLRRCLGSRRSVLDLAGEAAADLDALLLERIDDLVLAGRCVLRHVLFCQLGFVHALLCLFLRHELQRFFDALTLSRLILDTSPRMTECEYPNAQGFADWDRHVKIAQEEHGWRKLARGDYE
jgi:hypothetical protein